MQWLSGSAPLQCSSSCDTHNFATVKRGAIVEMQRTAALLRSVCSWGRHLTCASATDLIASTSYCTAGVHGPAQHTWSYTNYSSSLGGWGQLAYQPAMCWRGLAHSRSVLVMALLPAQQQCVRWLQDQLSAAQHSSVSPCHHCIRHHSACDPLAALGSPAVVISPRSQQQGEGLSSKAGPSSSTGAGCVTSTHQGVCIVPFRQKPGGPPQPPPRKAPERTKRPQLPHNELITAATLRVLPPEGPSTVMSLQEARAAAAQHQLDLVLIRWVWHGAGPRAGCAALMIEQQGMSTPAQVPRCCCWRSVCLPLHPPA
jgi:hypothetical protein